MSYKNLVVKASILLGLISSIVAFQNCGRGLSSKSGQESAAPNEPSQLDINNPHEPPSGFDETVDLGPLPSLSGERNPIPAFNRLPVIEVKDEVIVPTNADGSFTIDGKAEDEDGEVVATSWAYSTSSLNVLNVNKNSTTQRWLIPSGGEMTDPSKPRLSVVGLSAGLKFFTFSAIDNVGAIKSKQIKVHVFGNSTDAPIIGFDETTVSIPVTQATFKPKIVIYQGTIVDFQWVLIGGCATSATISNPKAEDPTLSGLTVKGICTVEVTAKDAANRQSTKRLSLRVIDQNRPPVIETTEIPDVTLPSNMATLLIRASDPEAQSIQTKWTYRSGPNQPSELKITPTRLRLSGLIVGTYSYSVTATDSAGATSTSIVYVKVVDPLAPPPPLPPLPLPPNNLVSIDLGPPAVNISFPQTSITLSPRITNAYPNATYFWSQRSGPAIAKRTTAASSPGVYGGAIFSNLIAGEYVFEYRYLGFETNGTSLSFYKRVTVIVTGTQALPSVYSFIASNITNKCATCHNSSHAFGDHLLAVSHNPEASPIYQKLSTGHQPFNIDVSKFQLDAIKRWIESGALRSN